MNLKKCVFLTLLTSLLTLLMLPIAVADLNVVETPPVNAGTVFASDTLTLTFKASYSGSTDSRAAISMGFDPSGWTYAGFTATMDTTDVSADFTETISPSSIGLTNDALEPDEGTLTASLIFTAMAEETYDFDWSSAFSIISGTNPDIKIAMGTTTATIVEVVEVGWIEGTVTDADTTLAIEGATVSADGYSDTTDALGFYCIEVSPGTCDVMAEMTGCEPQTVMDVSVVADATVVLDFALSPVPVVAPSIESSDADGNKKDTFNPSDIVYVYGSQYDLEQEYDIFVVADTSWTHGMIIPARIAGTATIVASDASGNIPATQVWSSPLTPGKYDIVVDFNGNGLYDIGIDALDYNDVQVTAGFFVVPEYVVGTILGLVACFAAFAVFSKSKRLHQTKTP